MNGTQNKQNSSLPCKSSEVQDLVVVIPAGITELPEGALDLIEDNAFGNCPNLTICAPASSFA